MLRSASRVIGVSIGILSHLAVIPVMAIYGVSICPVLGEQGFGFGCKYTGLFIAFVLVSNICVNGGLWLACMRLARGAEAHLVRLRYFPLISLVIHIGLFALGTRLLLLYLKGFHVPAPSLERLTVAFAYTALLIGVLQAEIVEWLSHTWLRAKLSKISATMPVEKSMASLTAQWLYGRVWAAMPFVAFVTISGSVVARKFMEIVEMDADEINVSAIHGVLFEISQVVVLLVGWLVLMRLFAMLREKQLIQSVHQHLNALSRLDADYQSPTVASGYWESIFVALNETSALIKQRARLIKGFSSYVTSSIVEKVLGEQPLKPEGEKRDLVILCSDLRNFTGISSTLPAEKVVQMLNVYFADMIEVLIEHDVTLDKFIGDGILAYVEPRSGLAKAAESAVRAGIAMHDKLTQTNSKLVELGLPALDLGVGVHTGSVVLGSIGSPERMQFTMIGDPVNVASRLEPLCKTLKAGVVVSKEVYQMLPTELRDQLTARGDQEIRGLKGGVAVYAWGGKHVRAAA